MNLTTTMACLRAKVTAAGLKDDPYTIPDEQWVAEPSEVPNVAWRDMFVYMIATPSAFTREEMKVKNITSF